MIDEAGARAQAAALEASGPRGPLRGFPVSVKDLFDVRGLPTTCGSPFYAGTRPLPEADCPYVADWRALGTVLVGKTNLNEFAYGITGENRGYGDVTQPGHPDRLTGGSSSGAAASVLMGAAAIGLGTDTGGSLRAPAALCGLVSYRATLGSEDAAGSFPLAHAFDTLGVGDRAREMAVYIDNLRLMDALSGDEITRIPLDGAFRERFGNPYAVVHRGDLHGVFLKACRDHPLVDLRTRL
jgi:Asp-tRNA(Asn)/Glu-tRNA(Gln) amidotransferase A subunit family amidase